MKKLFNIILFLLLITGANAQEFILRGTNNQSGMEHDLGPSDTINKSTFVQLVVTESAFIDSIVVNYVWVDSIVATNAIFDTLYVDSAFIDTLGVTYIIGETAHITDSAYINTLIYTELYGFFMWVASFLFAESSSFVLLDADTGDIRELVVEHLVVTDSASIDTIDNNVLYSEFISTTNLEVTDSAFIDTVFMRVLFSNKAPPGYLQIFTDIALDGSLGTDNDSYVLRFEADDGGVDEEATMQLFQGADPYLRISVDDDNTSPSLTGVFDIHDQIISFVSDGACDIGAVAGNRPNNIYAKQTIQGTDINGTTSLQLNGNNINTAGVLTNVAYENQANVFTENQRIEGDLTVTGVANIEIPHGCIGFSDSAVVITINQDTWTQVTNATGDLFQLVDTFRMNFLAGDTIEIVETGHYSVTGALGWSGNNNETWKIAIFKTTGILGFAMPRYTSSNDTGAAPIIPLVAPLAVGDKLFMMIYNSTDGDDPTVKGGGISIHKIGSQ